MNKSQAITYSRLLDFCEQYGLTRSDLDALLLAEKRLSTWSEHECNGVIQRDEETGIPYYYSCVSGKRLSKARDMEGGALNRIAAICARSKGLTYYHQTDPRGCSLYLLRPSDIPEGCDASAYYTRGIAICL